MRSRWSVVTRSLFSMGYTWTNFANFLLIFKFNRNNGNNLFSQKHLNKKWETFISHITISLNSLTFVRFVNRSLEQVSSLAIRVRTLLTSSKFHPKSCVWKKRLIYLVIMRLEPAAAVLVNRWHTWVVCPTEFRPRELLRQVAGSTLSAVICVSAEYNRQTSLYVCSVVSRTEAPRSSLWSLFTHQSSHTVKLIWFKCSAVTLNPQDFASSALLAVNTVQFTTEPQSIDSQTVSGVFTLYNFGDKFFLALQPPLSSSRFLPATTHISQDFLPLSRLVDWDFTQQQKVLSL